MPGLISLLWRNIPSIRAVLRLMTATPGLNQVGGRPLWSVSNKITTSKSMTWKKERKKKLVYAWYDLSRCPSWNKAALPSAAENSKLHLKLTWNIYISQLSIYLFLQVLWAPPAGLHHHAIVLQQKLKSCLQGSLNTHQHCHLTNQWGI